RLQCLHIKRTTLKAGAETLKGAPQWDVPQFTAAHETIRASSRFAAFASMAIMIPMEHTLEAGPEHCLYIGMRTMNLQLTKCFEPLQEKRQRDLSKSITRKQSSFDNTFMSAFKKVLQ